MSLNQHPELLWLTLTLALTGLLWVPYILQYILQVGPVAAIFDGSGIRDHNASWANRAQRAHTNAVENLVVFAGLVLIIVTLNIGDTLTEVTGLVFFVSRLVHALVYMAGIPLIRTLAFLTGFGCQVVLVLRIFGVV